MTPFWVALQFLTRIPTPEQSELSAQNLGRSVLYYPLIGLIIGVCLLIVAWLTQGMATGLSAALVLAVWVAITGALHLDGLADSVDAWVGGYGDRARTLAIMKDPACGAMAVTALVIVLLLKFAAISVLIEQQAWSLLLLAPVLGRASVVALLNWTPYVRPQGLGAALVESLPKDKVPWLLGVVILFAVAVAGWGTTVMVLLFAGTVYALLRASMMKRLAGTTGDTAGAVLEFIELVVLIVLVA